MTRSDPIPRSRGLVFASVIATVLLVALAGCVGPEGEPGERLPPGSGSDSGTTETGIAAAVDEEALLRDTDSDGLPDVEENYVYGSDPDRPSTTGGGVPDGWLADHGLDPTQPGVTSRPAAQPSPDRLPRAYEGEWPYNWTIADAYRHGIPADWNLSEDGVWDNGIDPRDVSYSDDGIPYAWLVHHGIDDVTPAVEDRTLVSDDFTVRDNYRHDTDPRRIDTDGDGLTDADEVRRHDTDPAAFSTSGTGIPDGWLVEHGYDPADPRIGTEETTGKGMTVLETWEYNRERFGAEAALHGEGLDPATVSTADTGVPDGWLVEHGLDPLDSEVGARVIQRASTFPEVRNVTDAPEGLDPLPDRSLTVADAYRYQRPAAWQESPDGVWDGGLDPTTLDEDGDGLPSVVEIRGWYAQRSLGLGPDAETSWYQTASDPTIADTDGDGLKDGEEYHGRAIRNDTLYRFDPSDPENADTAFSGLTDGQKVHELDVVQEVDGSHPDADRVVEPLLDPTRRDSAENYLADGKEFSYWTETAAAARQGQAYTERYSGSHHRTYAEWFNRLETFQGVSLSRDQIAAQLAPLGDADGDGIPNLADPDSDGDGLLDGWEIEAATLRFSDLPHEIPRQPTDPANPDTDADGLPDRWEVENGEPVEFGWDLSPAKWSSDGDDTSDADETLDDDVVDWLTVDGTQVTRHEFEYTNQLEHQLGTDPHRPDENGDGVTEGWVFFWGFRYPDLVCQDDAALGDTPPCEHVSARSKDIQEPLAPVGERVKEIQGEAQTVDYRRVEQVPVGLPVLEDGEELSEEVDDGDNENPGEFDVLQPEGGTEEMRLAIVDGTYEHLHARDQAFDLNPYTKDTDGDDLPDAWEALHACNGVDPSDPADPFDDPDKDGLTTFQEFSAKLGHLGLTTNPCEADTDAGGLADGQDPKPIDPNNDGVAGDEHSDEDQVTDRRELEGGTNPTIPDTDLDGLLDGDNLDELVQGESDETDDLIDALLRWGIMHEIDGDTYTFYGEGKKSLDTDPLDPHTVIPGVPDGWVFYFNQETALKSDWEEVREAYECNRPGWWDETRLGVWWWGVPPDETCRPDLDHDGLLDETGADPVPAADWANKPHADLPEDLEALAGTHPQDALRDAALRTPERVQIAQTWGSCAGDPTRCLPDWEQQGPGDRAEITVDGISWPDAVRKGEVFSVAGTVTIPGCEGGSCPAPNRTVGVYADGIEDPLGVAFTEPDGSFDVEACICAQREVTIDPEGAVARARDEGTVAWTLPTAAVPVGPVEFHVAMHATNTTEDLSHPQYVDVTVDGQDYHATQRNTSDGRNITVGSATDLSTSVPETLGWSATERTLPVGVNLLDGTSDPVSNRSVEVTAEAGTGFSTGATVTTDEEGQATAFLDVPSFVDGEMAVAADFDGTDLYDPSSADPATVILQGPNTVAIDLTSTSDDVVRIGADIVAEIAVTASDGDPVVNRSVSLALGSLTAAAETDDAGHATVTLSTSGLTPGHRNLTAEVAGTQRWASDRTAIPLRLVTGAFLDLSPPERFPVGRNVTVAGRLTAGSGDPIGDRTVTLDLASRRLANATTGDDGTFTADAQVPEAIEPGLQTLRASFPGVPGRYDATSTASTVRVAVPTNLSASTPPGRPGDTLHVEGELTDGDGRPLVGEHVTVRVADETVDRVLTDREGRFRVPYPIPDNASFGERPGVVVYDGSRNGTYGDAVDRFPVVVTAATRLQVTVPDEMTRGENAWSGRLTSRGEPVARAPVEVSPPDGPSRTVHTGTDGRLEGTFALGADPEPGPLTLRAAYDGNETLDAANASATGVLTVTPKLRAHVPADAGRGTDLHVEVAVLDDVDRPSTRGQVTIHAFGNATRTSLEPDGTATVRLTVPTDASLGPATIRIDGPDEPGLRSVSETRTVEIKEGAVLRLGDLPSDVRPGERIEIPIELHDRHGNPIADAPVAVRVDGVSTTTVAETGPDGTAAVLLTAPARDARIAVRYPGSTDYASANATTDQLSVQAPGAQPAGTAPGTLQLVGAGLAMFGLLGVAGLVVVKRRRRSEGVKPFLVQAEERIDAGESWHTVIQDTYRQLSNYLASLGFEERPTESPREFVQALHRAAPIPEDAAVRLVHLYEEASYADAQPDPEQADQAKQELQRIVAAIEEQIHPDDDSSQADRGE